MHLKNSNRIIALFLFLLSFAPLQSQDEIREQPLVLLGPKDSLLLLIQDGKKYFLHPIKPKHTLFSIARYYSLGLPEIYEHNPTYQTDPTLHSGARVKIPIPNKAIKRYKGTKFIASKHTPIYYVVQPGDNLYHICKRNFNMEPDTIAKRNKLRKNEIKPGQRLLVGWFGTEGVPPEWRPKRPVTKSDVLKSKFDKEKPKRSEIDSQGVCYWPKESKETGDLYALHRDAHIGSVIEIFNPMGSRRVYAKVIGRIPDGYERNIEVVVSPDVGKKLGSKDAKFFVKVKYLK